MSEGRNFWVEFVGGGRLKVRLPQDEDLDILLSEQFTAYGDCEIDMVYPVDPENDEPCHAHN